MVIVQRSANEMKLDLQLGNVVADVKNGKTIRLMQQGQEAQLTSAGQSTLNLSRDGGNLKLSSLGGSINFKLNDKTQTLRKEELLEVDKTLKTQKKKIDVILLKPNRGENIWLDSNMTLNLKWKINTPGKYKVEISKDHKFKSKVLSHLTNDNTDYATALKHQGQYYWRVMSTDKSQSSEVYSFKAITKKAPQIIFPKDNFRVKSNKKMNSKSTLPVRFDWKDKLGVSEYQFQVAKENSFKNPLYQETTPDSNVNGVALKKGDYYWRVRATGNTPISSLWSETGEFVVTDEDESDLKLLSMPETPNPDVAANTTPSEPEPEALNKLSNEGPLLPPNLKSKTGSVELLFNAGAKGRTPASLQKDLLNPPVFKWSRPQGATGYHLELSKEKEFKNSFKKLKTKYPSYKWKTAAPGQYYWRVRSVNEKGQSEFSDIGQLDLKLAPPVLQSEYIIKKKAKSPKDLKKEVVSLDWVDLPYTAKYKILVDDELDFSTPIGKKFKDSSKLSFKS